MGVYDNEEDRKKYLELYFTDEGIKSLQNRLQNLAKLFTKKNNYPLNVRMYGFVDLVINNEDHLLGMIDNLKQLLGLKEVVLVNKNGN